MIDGHQFLAAPCHLTQYSFLMPLVNLVEDGTPFCVLRRVGVQYPAIVPCQDPASLIGLLFHTVF